LFEEYSLEDREIQLIIYLTKNVLRKGTPGERGIDLTLMDAHLFKKSPSAGCLSYFIFHLYWLAAVDSIAKVHLIDREAEGNAQ
jgi:hypothetical protein